MPDDFPGFPLSHLILGGARSGKSRHAQRLAESSGKTPVLIATATAGDEEMAARIARHKAERGPAWQTIEEAIALVGILTREAAAEKILVVDCVTLWLANLMFKGLDTEAESLALAKSLATLPGPVIFVSNEVGLGLVPETALGRSFRDAQGRLNQQLAEICEAVTFIAAGLPLVLKAGRV